MEPTRTGHRLENLLYALLYLPSALPRRNVRSRGIGRKGSKEMGCPKKTVTSRKGLSVAGSRAHGDSFDYVIGMACRIPGAVTEGQQLPNRRPPRKEMPFGGKCPYGMLAGPQKVYTSNVRRRGILMDLSNPKAIADQGEAIYREKYKVTYEAEHFGKFVAIDVVSQNAYLADSAEDAMELARKEAPRGIFHLIKVGSAGAFRVSYTSNAKLDWIFR